MGYILPVIHHQYKAYHQRTVHKRRPFYIEEPYKVVSLQAFGNMATVYRERAGWTENLTAAKKAADQPAGRQPENPAMDDITGKGRYVTRRI